MRHIIISQAIDGKWMEVIKLEVEEDASTEDIVQGIKHIRDEIFNTLSHVKIFGKTECAIISKDHGPINIHLSQEGRDKKGKILNFVKEE